MQSFSCVWLVSVLLIAAVPTSIKTGSGHPVHIFSGSSGSDPVYNQTRIGSHEKRNCLFDDVGTYKRYRVDLS